MLGLTIKIKKISWIVWFGFTIGLLLSNNLFASQIITKPFVYFEVMHGADAVSPTLEELIDVLNKDRAAIFAKCISQETFGCYDYIYSNSKKISSSAVITNGLADVYFDVGKTTGTYHEKVSKNGEVNVYPVDIQGWTVEVFQLCPWPFFSVSGGNTQDKKIWCVANTPEVNSCTVGNPVDIITGRKYEHEVDYSSADGLLKVERFYVDQNNGWIMGDPPRLKIVPPHSEVESLPFYFKPIFKFSRSLRSGDTYDYVYPFKLYNPESYRVVYMLQNNKFARFDEKNSVFSSQDLAAKNTSLQAINISNNYPEKWLLISANNDKHYFGGDGKMLRTEYAAGGIIYYEYDGERLKSKTDQSSRRIHYSYDGYGRLASATPPDGNTITYEYTDRFERYSYFLKKVSWKNGEKISYVYNEADHMLDSRGGPHSPVSITGKFDPYGQRIGNYKYYSGKAVLTEGFAGINRKILDFSPGYTEVTDAINSTRKYTYVYVDGIPRSLTEVSQPAGSGCNASTARAEYIFRTTLKKSEINFKGHITQYGYDMNRQLETVRIEGIPSNQATDYRPANTPLVAGARKISTQWHASLTSPIKVAEPNLITTYIYNGDIDPFNGNAIAQCSPSAHPLLCHKVQQATTDNNGAAGFAAILDTSISKREWVYTYNERNQPLTMARSLTAAPLETREYYEFTSDSARKGDLKKITNALGHTTEFTQYDANGRPLKMLDNNRVETELTYDIRGRLTSQSIAGAAPTTHTYDLNGNRVGSTLPNGVQLTYRYDPAKRLTAIENALGDKISYEYDLESHLRFERVTNVSGAIGYIKEHIYDALGREKNTVNSFAQSQTHLYDANGNLTGSTDAKLQTTQHSYDALDRLDITTDAMSGKTDYGYDAQGRITEIKDARGNITRYKYNAFGDLISETSPDTGTTTYRYNALGNRTSKIDERAEETLYSYDALDRMKFLKYPAIPESFAYTYDDTSNGNLGVGRLTGIGSKAGNLNYRYNELGLISQKNTTVNGIGFTTKYTYDAAGNLASITYPSGRIVTYVRDIAGQVQTVRTKLNAGAAEQTLLSNIKYLPFGPASNYTYGNGLNHSANYDNDYRLTSISVGGVLNRSYGYDPVDNITSITNLLVSGKSQTFSYDALNRLTGATGIYGVLGYGYDAVGNRTSEKTDRGTTHLNDTYSYSPTSNRLTSISKTSNGVANGTRSFDYDKAGNRIQATTDDGKMQNYSYSKGNRLDSAKVNNTLVGSYTYNPLGQRISKTLGNSKELYHYDEAGQLIAVTDATGNMLREYIYNGNQLCGFVTMAGSAIPPISLHSTAASLQGKLVIANSQSGYLGSGYIKFNGEGQASWAKTIAATGNYTLSVRNSLAAPNRPLALLVDGVQKATINFSTTADWNTWAYAKATLKLTAGSHSFTLKTTGSGGPNIDKLSLTAAEGTTGPAAPTQFYVHNDHLGTPQVVTNQAQAVVWMGDYQPFGKLQPGQTNSIELYSRFPGQYLDSETGLYYNYFRDYDPTIGRYIESDPIGLAGGINTYAYVEGNPILYIDPFGNSKVQGQPSIGGSDSAVSGVTKNSTKAEIDAAIKRAQDILNDPKASAARKKFLKGWIKVAKRGFSKAVCPPLMEDILLDVSRNQCLQGDMDACATFQFLGGTIINPYEA